MWLLLRTRVRRALGRVLTPLLLGLLRLLLRCRNHLIYGALSCGCYTNAYEMIECNSNYIITIPKMKCPADCPQPNGGPSAVQLRRPTRTSNVSGEFLDWLVDCPRLSSGLSATHFCNPTRTDYFSGQISNLYCGLSAHP